MSEAIALTEKKMDMSLDDIIKMSKKTTSKGKIPPRASNKSQGFLNGRGPQGNINLHRFMDSRSSIRQGVLAKRRTHFQGNQFPITTNVANRAASYSANNRMVNWNKPRAAGTSFRRNDGEKSVAGKDKMLVPKQKPQTLDARFANIKEQRMRAMTHQQQMVRGSILQTMAAQRRHTHQQHQGRGTTQYGRASRPFGKFAR
ncbi:hypothetical protein DsansV1_C11g0110671 [Dioscorea sansibarensis]